MRIEGIRNVELRRIADALDPDSISASSRRRIKSVRLRKKATIGGIHLPDGTELRFKEGAAEDVLVEARLGKEATIAGVRCIEGAEIGFYESHPPRLKSVNHAFEEVVEIQGFPAYEMSEVLFHPNGDLQQVRLGAECEFRKLKLARGTFLRLPAGKGDFEVSLAAALELYGIEFPAKTALTFTQDGHLHAAFVPSTLNISGREFKPRTMIRFTSEGQVRL